MAAVFDPDTNSTATVTISQLEKNETVDADVEIDADPDDSARIHQVLDDGSYVPAGDSKMERNAALSSMFVARTLAERHGIASRKADEASAAAGNSQAKANDDPLSIYVDNRPEWCINSWKYGEGALYEAGRVLAILECLRTDSQTSSAEAKLQFRRVQRQLSKRSESEPKSFVPAGILKEGASILMAKQRSLALCATTVDNCVSKLRKWVKDDNDFSDAFHYLRINACGVRRSNTTGVPLIDVGDGVFSQVERVVHDDNEQIEPAAAMLPFAKRCLARVAVPPSMYLCIGFNRLENDCVPVPAPIVQSTDTQSTVRVSLETVLRRIRLARVSAFRKMTFDRLIREATDMKGCLDFTVNSVSVESGPYNILRIDRTLNPIAPNLAAASEEIALDGDNFRAVQDSSLLQVVVLYQSMQTNFNARDCSRQGKGVFARALGTTNSLKLLRALENILDSVVSLLGVRVVWSRGSSRPDEARAYVLSDEADGDGPSRMLLVVEPISDKNNGGSPEAVGHVRVTPAYGVIIPAPDDPTGRGRTAVLTAQHSTQAGVAPSILFDDVPRSFVSPVLSGSEITAAVTLLLCIRLLDAFENVARAGKSEVLDVDRQCFLVVVSSPQSGRTLRAKVWPKGANPGQEVPATTAWFNGKIVEGFPSTAPGRLFAWKKLLDLLVTDKDISNEPGSFFGFRN